MDLSDSALWALAARGDHAAFETLFNRHSKAVYNHCFRLTASWAQAEDATQATFVIAWRKGDQARLVNDSILPWLLSVASNAVRDERRSARRWLAALLRMPWERTDAAEMADDVAGRVDDIRRMRTVLKAVRQLSRAEREALMLCVWSAVSYADAAKLLGITEGSVRARVSRARSRLNHILHDETVQISRSTITSGARE
jgi:RNA polymerase sigma factor (sigma-70 family)